MSAGDGTLNTGSRLDPRSQAPLGGLLPARPYPGQSLPPLRDPGLPGRPGLAPGERAGWVEFAAALGRAAEDHRGDKQRRAFTAVTVEGVPAEVLASGLGSSRSAIYKALFEARRTLRARLAADGH